MPSSLLICCRCRLQCGQRFELLMRAASTCAAIVELLGEPTGMQFVSVTARVMVEQP
jgi:hypothetical protein